MIEKVSLQRCRSSFFCPSFFYDGPIQADRVIGYFEGTDTEEVKAEAAETPNAY